MFAEKPVQAKPCNAAADGNFYRNFYQNCRLSASWGPWRGLHENLRTSQQYVTEKAKDSPQLGVHLCREACASRTAHEESSIMVHNVWRNIFLKIRRVLNSHCNPNEFKHSRECFFLSQAKYSVEMWQFPTSATNIIETNLFWGRKIHMLYTHDKYIYIYTYISLDTLTLCTFRKQ